MALIVYVYVNNTLIATAAAQNITDEGDLSNYKVESLSEASPVTGKPKIKNDFEIKDHDRNQSAWALVEKMAKAIAEQEK